MCEVAGSWSYRQCELPYGCWELNPGPLEEQSVLLITEPSLQPQISKSEDSPVYRVSSRTARAIQRNLVSKTRSKIKIAYVNPPN